MYVTASSVSISNFGTESLGLVSGMVHAFRSGVPGLLMVLYMYTFSSDYYADEFREDRVFIYFSTITVCYLVSNVMAICIYGTYRGIGPGGGHTVEHTSIGHLSESYHVSVSQRTSRMSRSSAIYTYIPNEEHQQDDNMMAVRKSSKVSIGQVTVIDPSEKTPLLCQTVKGPIKDNETQTLSALGQSLKNKEALRRTHIQRRRSAILRQRSIWEGIKSPEFHLIFWPSAVVLGHRSSFGANIRAFADSFGLFSYAKIILTILPVVSTLSKPPIGLCSDALIKYIPRSVLLIIWTLAAALVDTLCIFYMNHEAMQAVAVVTIILCSSFIQTLAPPLMVTALGRKFFPIGWACVTVGWSSCTSLFNLMIGFFYEMNTLPGTSKCLGLTCYTYSFIISALGCLVSAILYCFLLRKELFIRRTME